MTSVKSPRSSRGNKNGSGGGPVRNGRSPPEGHLPPSPIAVKTYIRDVKNSGEQQTVASSMTVKIVCMTPAVQDSNNSTKIRFAATLADSTGAVRAWIYVANNLQPGHYIRIRNFGYRQGRVAIHSKCSMIRSPPCEIPEAYIQEAKNIFMTPVAPFRSIREIKELQPKVRVSYRGTIIMADNIRDVAVGIIHKSVREIQVRDDTDTIFLSMWDSAVEMDVSVGSKIEARDVLTVHSAYHNQLVTSTNHPIELLITTPEKSTSKFTIEAIGPMSDTTYQAAVLQDGKEIDLMIQADVLRDGLGITTIDIDELIASLPMRVIIEMNGEVITSLRKITAE